MTKTQLLYRAFDVPDRDLELEEVSDGTTCAITGEPITEGVRSMSLVTKATAGPHEIFPNPNSDYCSWEAAQCYKYFKGGLTGNLLTIKGPADADHLSTWGYKPMVSTSSASRKDRPCWQSVLYGTDDHVTLGEGTPCLAVFTEEFQRRLWLDAKVSTAGPHWKPYLFSGSTRRSLEVALDALRDALALCEYVYTLGFTKAHLRTSLLGAMSKVDLLTDLGPARVRTLDEALEAWRGTDELLLAAFVCQRADFDVSDNFQSQIKALDAPTALCQIIPQPAKASTPTPDSTKTTSSEKESPRREAPQKETASPTRQMGLFS